MTSFIKDPDATLDWEFPWHTWLATGETITSFVVTADPGITLAPTGFPSTESGGKVTAWLAGGSPGTRYALSCRITTSAGRVDERTYRITVQHR